MMGWVIREGRPFASGFVQDAVPSTNSISVSSHYERVLRLIPLPHTHCVKKKRLHSMLTQVFTCTPLDIVNTVT